MCVCMYVSACVCVCVCVCVGEGEGCINEIFKPVLAQKDTQNIKQNAFQLKQKFQVNPLLQATNIMITNK